MKYENVILSGSLQVSGSLVLPSGPTNPSTGNSGDLFFNTTSGKAFGYRDEDGWNDLASMSTYVEGLENVEYLVVAGGGSGGGWGGGAGAGGMLTGTLTSKITSGAVLDIIVGAGASRNAYGASGDADYQQGLNGSSSSLAPNSGYSFTRIDTVGGGGGGDYVSGNATAGNDGGSGGGAAARHPSYSGASGGSGTAGQGNDGGSTAASGNYYPGGGGGGGKGQNGQQGSGNTGGPGGSGSLSTITGTATYYAGGGSGHSPRTDDDPGTPTAPGGGGAGGRYQTAGGSTSQRAAGDGTANTGGGGGGGYGYQSYTVGLGGSGIVVLAYTTGSLVATGGVRNYYNNKVAHIFQSSGQLTVGDSKTLTHGALDPLGDGSGIALWQLDGDANDRSGNYNGTAYNVTFTQGYINQGGVFNGSNSYITVAHNTVFDLESASSFSVWLKKNNTTREWIMDKDGGSGAYSWQLYKNAGENWKFQMHNTGNGAITLEVSDTTDLGTWYHITVTHNGSNLYKLYLDGSLQDSATLSGTIANSTSNLTIGKYSAAGGYEFDGMIDQIRFFNKELSAAEVLTISNE